MTANQNTRLTHDLLSIDFLNDPVAISTLQESATTFVKYTHDTIELWAASRDWFLEEWGRDAFVSIRGLLLTTKRYDEAQQVFTHFAAYEKNGLIPNVIRGDEVLYNTVDASLWYIYALRSYAETTQDWPFIEKLMPTLRNIIDGYMDGTGYEREGTWCEIKTDPADCLVASPAQATWMDADPSGDGTTIVTPRDGKCVEINALWYSALRFVCEANEKLGNKDDTARYEVFANHLQQTFIDKFWNPEAGCLFDFIDGKTDEQGSSIRPNQLIAISHGEDLLDSETKRKVLEVASRDLLTPGGLRTLSPHDKHYIGSYDTSEPVSVKDLAYHQGTAWPWLIGTYCDAVSIVRAEQGVEEVAIKNEVKQAIAPLVRFCLDSEYQSLPEVFSGDAPHEPGGTSSQAWSVAEVLRILEKVNST